MKSVVFFFLLLQISCLAQSSGQNGNRKLLILGKDPVLPEACLKNTSGFISLLDSTYFFDWDTLSNSWISTARNTYQYNTYGLAIDKHTDFFGAHPDNVIPYSQEIRMYYPNGRLKEQENRLWSSTRQKYLGVTRQHYDFDGRGNIIDFLISYRNELSDEWYAGYRVRQYFDVRNNMTEYYEYKSPNPGSEPELTRKQFSYYNQDNNLLKFTDSVKNSENGSYYCSELQQYQYDILGRETDYIFSQWNEDAHTLIPKLKKSSNYISITELENIYYSYDDKNSKWLNKSKIIIIHDAAGRPVDEKYFHNSDEKWIPSLWTTTIYENNNDYSEKVNYEWKPELFVYLPVTRFEKIYIANNRISEFNQYTYKNGWICNEKTRYEYDQIGNLVQVENLTLNDSNNTLVNRSKWNNFYTLTYTDPIPEEPTSGLKVFPNPAGSLIFIYNVPMNSILRIFDSQGRSVYEKQVVSPDNVIDISGFSDGIYNISLVNRNTKQSASFIKVERW